MAEASPIRLLSRPGIKRDGTEYDGDNYTDGEWCRFQRGLPRKIGGYKAITNNLPEVVRGLTSFSAQGTQFVHLGSAALLTQALVDSMGVLIGLNDRTPAGFAADANNIWQFSVLTTTAGTPAPQLVAHAAPNLSDISDDVETPIYFGITTDPTALVATGMDPQSGGILVLPPYLVSFGNFGRVDVSSPNDLTTPPQSAFVTGQKIIRGLPLQGSVPAGLLWSLDSLIRMTFDPTLLSGIPFRFNTITDDTSILSAASVIEYDGVYYWVANDRFLMYNGVIREVPNEQNANFFFDNLRPENRQKVFSFKVPRFGEIWICFPFGDATECDHAIVLNVNGGYWFDTPLPRGGRSSGLYAKVYTKPFMTDAEDTGVGIRLWQHETGVNEVAQNGDASPIRSSFTTSEMSLPGMPQDAQNRAIQMSFMESDFVQAGNLTVTLAGRANARSPTIEEVSRTITPVATTAEDQLTVFKNTMRLMKFTFESNAVEGDYQMGKILAHIRPSDQKMVS